MTARDGQAVVLDLLVRGRISATLADRATTVLAALDGLRPIELESVRLGGMRNAKIEYLDMRYTLPDGYDQLKVFAIDKGSTILGPYQAGGCLSIGSGRGDEYNRTLPGLVAAVRALCGAPEEATA